MRIKLASFISPPFGRYLEVWRFANDLAQLSLGGIVTNLPAVRAAKNVNTKFNRAASIFRNVDFDTATTAAGSPSDRLAQAQRAAETLRHAPAPVGKTANSIVRGSLRTRPLLPAPSAAPAGSTSSNVASLAMISSPG